MEVTITKDNFQSEVLESAIPVLVDFWAPWCGPCRMVGPVIEQIAKEKEGVVKVGKVNVDEEPDLAAQFGVASIPTLLLFKEGEVADKTIGAQSKEALEKFIEG